MPTLGEACDDYIESGRHLAEATEEEYRRHLEALREHLKGTEDPSTLEKQKECVASLRRVFEGLS